MLKIPSSSLPVYTCEFVLVNLHFYVKNWSLKKEMRKNDGKESAKAALLERELMTTSMVYSSESVYFEKITFFRESQGERSRAPVGA